MPTRSKSASGTVIYSKGFARAGLFALMFLASCAGSRKGHVQRLPGTWQESKVTIDGSNKDWPSPYPEYDDKAALGYCVSNDKENLYITVETGDPATQIKILRNGLTVWIDKTGKKEETTAINFPIPQIRTGKETQKSRDDRSTNRTSSGNWTQNQTTTIKDAQKKKAILEDQVRALLNKADAYSLQGFKSCNLEFPLMERDSCGIVVRIALDEENELVWEAIVPFKTFYYKKEVGKADKGRPLTVCFETTGSKKPAGQTGNSHHGGRGGGIRPSIGIGGFGPMGMTMGGGRGIQSSGGGTQNGNDEMELLYKDTKTYKTFGIAWYETK